MREFSLCEERFGLFKWHHLSYTDAAEKLPIVKTINSNTVFIVLLRTIHLTNYSTLKTDDELSLFGNALPITSN
jgi:hypothetical protein